jgi:UDP-N-acetylglucosamine 2-epimerase
MHPRIWKRIDETKAVFNELVRLVKPFGFIDYVKLQIDAKAVLSDRGTVFYGSPILNFPVLNIREISESDV